MPVAPQPFPSHTGSPEASFIAGLYQNILGRPVDPSGLAFGSSTLSRPGATRDTLIQAVWESPEHRTDELIQDYQHFLGRTPGAAELAGWASSHSSINFEPQAADVLPSSPEFLAEHSGLSNYVNTLYADVLGRSADPGGFAALTGDHDAGEAPGSIALTFLTAPEADTTLVLGDFEALLHRAPSSADVSTLDQQLESGQQTPETVAVFILSSAEYYAAATASSD